MLGLNSLSLRDCTLEGSCGEGGCGGKKYGPRVEYWSNGQLNSKGTYKDGRKDGPWVDYHTDGTVWGKYTGTFKNGVKVD